VSLKSIIRGAARVVTWPVRAPVKAATNAAEDLAMDWVKQFILKAVYGFLAAFVAVLTQAGGIHSDDKATQIVWAAIVGGLTGLVALLKKLLVKVGNTPINPAG